jgi:sugar (pentulose or hexulose) kinase
MRYFIGIDFGTSGARAVAIDPQAQICAQANARFELDSVQCVDRWQSILFELLSAIPQEYRSAARAIAINGTSSTVLLCDAAGEAIGEPLLYNDDRGAVVLSRLQQVFDLPEYHAASGRANVLNATSSLVKLLWWQTQPGFNAARYLLHQADWLGFLLHGHLGISDYHNSLKLGYDVHQLTYPDWLRSLTIFPLLPRVLAPSTPIAPVRPAIGAQFGLPTDCQVCAGTTDSIAAFIASGATAPGEAVTSLGSTIVLKLLSTVPVEQNESGIYSHRYGDLWLVGGASNTGGAVLQQFFTAQELQALSAQIDPDRPSPLNYYPLLKPGERFPINDPQLPPRLEPRPDAPSEFLYGLLEGMSRIEAIGYRLLQDLGATPLQRVYTAGGGAQNPIWTKIRARHLGVPVEPSCHTEAAYGTALLAQQGGLRTVD